MCVYLHTPSAYQSLAVLASLRFRIQQGLALELGFSLFDTKDILGSMRESNKEAVFYAAGDRGGRFILVGGARWSYRRNCSR
ncbi:MAG: hypothetical protein LBG90_06650 [Spirochaetaceae bacterium]|nr:hypothetical protein [Spirochaetaceae bacterium]